MRPERACNESRESRAARAAPGLLLVLLALLPAVAPAAAQETATSSPPAAAQEPADTPPPAAGQEPAKAPPPAAAPPPAGEQPARQPSPLEEIAGAKEIHPAGDAEIAGEIDRLLTAAYPAGEPGAAVIVVKGEEVLLREGYGLADLAGRVPVAPSTLFRLGSLSEPFTAAAVLLLAQEGKLDLAAPVTAYLPGYPAAGRRLTLDRLLAHTSGVPSYIPAAEGPGRHREPALSGIVDLLAERPLDFEPGEGWRLDEGGYLVLAAVVEKVSGMSFADFLARRIFHPLGMEHTRCPGPGEVVAGAAVGYLGSHGSYRRADDSPSTLPCAAAGVLTSVEDLARWGAALTADRPLTAASRQRMETAATLADGRSTHFGYGWAVWEYEGHRVLQRDGGGEGFAGSVVRLPDDGIFVAVLSNAPGGRKGPPALALAAATRLLRKPIDDRLASFLLPEVLDGYLGVYAVEGEPGKVWTVGRAGLQLFARRGGGDRLDLFARRQDLFFVGAEPLELRFERDAQGRVVRLVVAPNAGPDEVAVKSAGPPP
jgi:CubicO group peptidase (beta-lactamase class C family)